MKETSMHNGKPQSLLTLGSILLLTGWAFGFAAGADHRGPGWPGKTFQPLANEAPVQRSDGNFKSFAPAVTKVAPAVVRIVAALTPDNVATGQAG